MQDVQGSSHHHENVDHPGGPLLYMISCMHCMTVSLAQGGDGLGAMWGRGEGAGAAGRGGVRVRRGSSARARPVQRVLRGAPTHPSAVRATRRFRRMTFTTRPELRGTFGMVASTHWLASADGDGRARARRERVRRRGCDRVRAPGRRAAPERARGRGAGRVLLRRTAASRSRSAGRGSHPQRPRSSASTSSGTG